MELVRKEEQSGLAKKKRKLLVTHAQAGAKKKTQRAVERAARKALVADALDATQIISDTAVIQKMNVETIDAQLDKLKSLGVPDIKQKSRHSVRVVKLQSLATPLVSYLAFILKTPMEPTSPAGDTIDELENNHLKAGEDDDMDYNEDNQIVLIHAFTHFFLLCIHSAALSD
jgi:hypothetical protein